ncbi:MAG: iron-sulfur containing oxygenase [Betaproteobacteria bacterium]|nr:iron-sulfur containing oxygenase [Betaproteobacteria bacterium]
MNQADRKRKKADHMELLPQTSSDSLMGRLLRKFWQPVALSRDIECGVAKPLRILGEDLTLYRGDSGRPYLVGARCAHRLTLLHTGWVEGEAIRCIYHGWKYDGTGQCIERPVEKDPEIPKIKIPGYALREYSGLIFAYLGDEPVPEFDLPRKDVLERKEGVVVARAEKWPCNWFQQVENSLDAAHVSFVHRKGLVGLIGAAVTMTIPDLTYSETDAGIEQVATRSNDNVRKSDWTFPNNNHIVVPGLAKNGPWWDICIWNVPNDNENTTRFLLYSTSHVGEEAERFKKFFADYGNYNLADHHDELFFEGKFPQDPVLQLTSAQDYVAHAAQGTVADRANELLGKSDAGIVFLRRMFWRELEAIRTGNPTKQWRRRSTPANMPTQPG